MEVGKRELLDFDQLVHILAFVQKYQLLIYMHESIHN